MRERLLKWRSKRNNGKSRRVAKEKANGIDRVLFEIRMDF